MTTGSGQVTVGFRPDIRALQQRVGAMDLARSAARAASVGELGARIAQQAIATSPYETGRYIRGLVMMHNDAARAANSAASGAGVPLLPEPPVKSSTRHEQRVLGRLRASVRRAGREREKLVQRIRRNEATPGGPRYKPLKSNPSRARGGNRPGGMWKSHRKLLRRLDKVGDIEDSAIELLEKYAASVRAGGGADLVIGGRQSRSGRLTKGSLASLRSRLYGGSARVVRLGDVAFIELTHHEPHARIIERGGRTAFGTRIPAKRIVARAINASRSAGARQISARYIKQLRAADVRRAA